jgi:hypothetical protein
MTTLGTVHEDYARIGSAIQINTSLAKACAQYYKTKGPIKDLQEI